MPLFAVMKSCVSWAQTAVAMVAERSLGVRQLLTNCETKADSQFPHQRSRDKENLYLVRLVGRLN